MLPPAPLASMEHLGEYNECTHPLISAELQPWTLCELNRIASWAIKQWAIKEKTMQWQVQVHDSSEYLSEFFEVEF